MVKKHSRVRRSQDQIELPVALEEDGWPVEVGNSRIREGDSGAGCGRTAPDWSGMAGSYFFFSPPFVKTALMRLVAS